MSWINTMRMKQMVKLLDLDCNGGRGMFNKILFKFRKRK